MAAAAPSSRFHPSGSTSTRAPRAPCPPSALRPATPPPGLRFGSRVAAHVAMRVPHPSLCCLGGLVDLAFALRLVDLAAGSPPFATPSAPARIAAAFVEPIFAKWRTPPAKIVPAIFGSSTSGSARSASPTSLQPVAAEPSTSTPSPRSSSASFHASPVATPAASAHSRALSTTELCSRGLAPARPPTPAPAAPSVSKVASFMALTDCVPSLMPKYRVPPAKKSRHARREYCGCPVQPSFG